MKIVTFWLHGFQLPLTVRVSEEVADGIYNMVKEEKREGIWLEGGPNKRYIARAYIVSVVIDDDDGEEDNAGQEKTEDVEGSGKPDA